MKATQEDTPRPTDNRYAQNSVIATYYTYMRRVYCNVIVVGSLYFIIY